jgi:hypothetical protein
VPPQTRAHKLQPPDACRSSIDRRTRMAQIGIGIFAVGVVAVAFVLALRCPAEKIPEPARWLGAWFKR